MNKKIIWIAIPIVIFLIIFFFKLGNTSSHPSGDILIRPNFGKFVVTVTTTGEMRAKNSTEIRGPENARMVRIWNMKISDLVEEGTVVKAGDYVAELDRSELTSKIEDTQLNLDKLKSQLTQAMLDSSLSLSQARNEITNLKYNVEQMKLHKEQSKFEAPATQRQAEIDFEKAERSLSQAMNNYGIKVQQAIEKIKIVEADLAKEQRQFDLQTEIGKSFKIFAPENGIVIYAKEWDGKKKVVGSTVSGWDPVVATLPDLSIMESVTYVNEVDIQKVKIGQEVTVTLDAIPGKKMHGTVTSVANMGEKQPNSDSKVYEVVIEIEETNPDILPAMTTANTIVVADIDSVIFIPLECIFAEDSLSIVFIKKDSKVIKQHVKLDLVNEDSAVITNGVLLSDEIYLSAPEDSEKLDVHQIIDNPE
ncbi:MAG: efflux RND transporter periplasmic adaptor subunit [Fidelibacterota bacterium]